MEESLCEGCGASSNDVPVVLISWDIEENPWVHELCPQCKALSPDTEGGAQILSRVFFDGTPDYVKKPEWYVPATPPHPRLRTRGGARAPERAEEKEA
jgi:hypothetical protein